MSLRTTCLLTLILFSPCVLPAEEPLHRRIDRLILEELDRQQITPAVRCDDATFVRRAYLDLTGIIPPASETQAFLEDQAPDKRVQLIDRLLASPRHYRHLQQTFDVMLMERRPAKYVTEAEWRNWLRDSFRENKPLDQLVKELLSADGTDEKTRPAARFLMDRGLVNDETVRDLGRILLGRDMECAQCHDHPAINDYHQQHYYGLSAFLQRSYIFTDRKANKSFIGEKADGTVTYASVFTDEKGETAPRMLDLPEIKDPPPEKELYKAKPTSAVRGVPAYSRREQLAPALVNPDNLAFQQNLANRIWALVMGRGLVEPLDLWHSDNPPAHPQVLNLLTEEMHRSGYDLNYLLRELLLTETYQRSSRLPEGVESVPAESFAVAILKPLTPEQLGWSLLQATGVLQRAEENAIAAEQKKNPKTAGQTTADPFWREEQTDQALAGTVSGLVTVFASQSISTEFEATAHQALYLANHATPQSWLAPSAGSLTRQLSQIDEPAQLVEQLYLTVYSRPPAADEAAVIHDYLPQPSTERTAALPELIWALLSSAEFRFNH